MARNVERLQFTPSSEFLPLNSETQITPPAGVDLFLAGTKENSFFSQEIRTNSKLIDQAKQRRDLSQKIGEVFNSVVDVNMNIDQALEANLIISEQVTEVYNSLADFIQTDTNNSRIILYLPSQILPSLNSKKELPDDLITAQNKFTDIYKKAWFRLLYESDIRANFVDGDILEPEIGEPPRVRKAAHLVPTLLKCGMINKSEVLKIIEITSDNEIKHSLKEGLSETTYLKEPIPEFEISPNRARWKKQVHREESLVLTASNLAEKFQDESFSLSKETDHDKQLINLKSIFIAGENFSINNNNEKAIEFGKKYQQLIIESWQTGDLETKNIIVNGLSHWHKLAIIETETLNKLGITVPDLSLPLPINPEKIVSQDFNFLIDGVKEILQDKKLSENIYPAFLIFGSRVKGYADQDADKDLAIFFKPNTLLENRDEILELLHNKIPELNNIEKILEYWTEDRNGNLRFRQISEKIKTIIGPPQIHFLTGGIWIGSGCQKLQQDLLEQYFKLDSFGDQKEQVRLNLLRQIEIDVLQCRLMHKGYRKFYPSRIPTAIENNKLIDGKSDYWDPGFRRVATQLFLSRVFLPDLN